MSNNHLNFAKKMKDDEYYTRRFLVDLIFDKAVEVFGTKNVLYVLAADTGQSFYTKYAQTHHLNYVNNIDLYNVPNFIYAKPWKTVVITNPPFSLLVDWLKKIHHHVEHDGLQLCLIIHLVSITTKSLLWYLQNAYFYPFNSKMNMFFHNFELKSVSTALMTTFPLKDWPVQRTPSAAPTANEFTTPITRIVYKSYYQSCGYQLATVLRPANGFKQVLWKKKNNPE